LSFLLFRNESLPFSKESVEAMPVDLYIGGKEHATLHLYFARFMTRLNILIGVCCCGLIEISESPMMTLTIKKRINTELFKHERAELYIQKKGSNPFWLNCRR